MKGSTTVEEQIGRLRSRGLIIQSEEKAKEILLDIGYFRLGFYCFPFEKTYPKKENRTHEYKEGSYFRDVVTLYYFDFRLRNILLKYISRIEINFRTKVIYLTSLKYTDSPKWFVDKRVMSREYIENFDRKIYTSDFIKNNSVIKYHHQKYSEEKYAPTWKTLEYFTFGMVINTYRNLNDTILKNEIAKEYGVQSLHTFLNYMNTIKYIRNRCAHGGVLFDISLPKSLKKGPALLIDKDNNNTFHSAILVIEFILGKISKNRQDELKNDLSELFKEIVSNQEVKGIIETGIGYEFTEKEHIFC